jgi:YebC/PmpR family DNA-binding regulatory protein
MGAKSKNMPVDNITRAIKKGTGELEGIQYEEHTYEGYGPGGAAIFLEAMTDNKNRTVSEIRAALGKAGGNLGENGCVGWMFEQKGLITVKTEAKSEDDLMELAIDAGADDLQTVDEHYEITTAVENFEVVRKALEDAGVLMELAEITRIPQNTVSIDEKKGKALLKLMDILDDHDDIQKAYSNFDISNEVMAAIIENS